MPFLETLCVDAAKSELEPSNTSPSFFYFATVLQPICIFLMCLLLPGNSTSYTDWNSYHTIALLCYLPHWLGYAYSELSGSDKWFGVISRGCCCPMLGFRAKSVQSCRHNRFDVTEDFGYFCLFIFTYKNMGFTTYWHHIVWIMAFAWCTRLLVFLAWRIVKVGKDWRFDKLITHRSSSSTLKIRH